jgi:polyisoprenoid-binding protein YceI
MTMTRQLSISFTACAVIAGLVLMTPVAARAQSPLSMASASVSIAGSSNIHDYTASTKDVKLVKLAIAPGVAGAAVVTNPAAVEGFEIAIKAASLKSTKDGLDKNMYKALKVTEFPEIVFRLTRLEGTAAALKAIGTLKIAGVEKDVTFDLKAVSAPTTLTITGEVPLLMTDYGIAPPKAMMGVLKTNPKVTVKFETVFAIASTF